MTASGKIRWWIFTALVLCLALPVPAQNTRPDEYKLKTAYLHRFAEFVNWPAAAPTGRVVIGIVHFEPYRSAIRDKVDRTTIESTYSFVDIDTPEQARSCHILFVNTTDRAVLRSYLDRLADMPVLVVTDVRNGARQGAAINFFTIDGRIRFAINQDAANRNGLEISSRLLRLGLVAKDASTEGENNESD